MVLCEADSDDLQMILMLKPSFFSFNVHVHFEVDARNTFRRGQEHIWVKKLLPESSGDAQSLKSEDDEGFTTL